MPRLSVSHSPARRQDAVPGPPPERGFRALEFALATLVGALAFTLYLRTLAPGLLGGDSGEFQFAAWLGGFAHPTGYPLYLMLGHVWSRIIWANTPAWRMNLFSALWGGVATGLVYLLAFRLLRLVARGDIQNSTGRWPIIFIRMLAALAAITFCVTPTFWSQAVIAEVYTLHAAFIAAVLIGLVAWAELPASTQDYRPLYWAAGVYGFSLTHHRGMLLLIPAR